jgi:SpoVK/Ycf46/Vps4 family AAA+-type ATPase
MSYQKELTARIKAGFGLFYVQTHEESRILYETAKLAVERKYNLFLWSITKGFSHRIVLYKPDGAKEDAAPEVVDLYTTKTKDIPPNVSRFVVNIKDAPQPEDAIEMIVKGDDQGSPVFPHRSIFIMLDFYHYFEDAGTVRRCRDAIELAQAKEKKIIFVGADRTIPLDLEKSIALVDYELPNQDDIDIIMGQVEEATSYKCEAGLRKSIVDNCRGMGAEEIEDALSLSFVVANNGVEKPEWNHECLQILQSEKAQTIKKSGVIEYIEAPINMDEVGGLQNLKQWIRQRHRAFSDEAKAFGVDPPKGLLLAGPAGTGKSLSAKAIAATMELPLLKLDFGRIFNKYVGQSESQLRTAIGQAESVAPCIWWWDEFEKMISTGQNTDSGVTSRLMGTLLSWLQEKTKPVFVVATTNEPHRLGAPMLRKGRWDEIFLVDFPNHEERVEIWRIHLHKRDRNPDKFPLDELANSSNNFSGSEIESCVKEGIISAFDKGKKDVDPSDLIGAIKRTKPQAESMKQDMDQARKLLESIAIPATAQTVTIGKQAIRKITTK